MGIMQNPVGTESNHLQSDTYADHIKPVKILINSQLLVC